MRQFDAHICALACGAILLLASCHGTRPATVGIHGGKLSPCPSTPNCVSSRDPDDAHRTEPFFYTGSAADAMTRLRSIILSLPRTEIVEDHGAYLHVECTSMFFRFVDDLEFLVDDAAKRIDVRSASRIGHSDLGVNRKRLEQIREKWSLTRG